MIQRKTQTAEYWQSFSLTQDDVDHLHNLLLDAEQPVTTGDLALAVVTERCRQEETVLRAELMRGALYQPRKKFNVGERIIFPALDFRMGEVIAVRPGQNPEHGSFEVVTVDFGPDRRQRSFAAALNAPHKLNADTPDLFVADELVSPERLLAGAARKIPAVLAAQLAVQPNFASFEDRWLLRDLLADVHVGHLNIAEAVIEMRGVPVDSADLLHDLDLPAEFRREALLFSLHSALAADGRFDQVGPGPSRRWFLRRLEPAEALATPALLGFTPFSYERAALGVDLLQLEWELDDEWSDESAVEVAPQRAALSSTTLLLTYPHLISGTLPINKHTQAFFPRGYGERTMVTLVDGRWGQRFTAWVVHGGRYVAGLKGWFDQHKLPAGAQLTLERKGNTGEVLVDFKPKRMRREWTRRALVVEGNRLDIQLRKQEVACEYDELAIIGDDHADDMARLRANPLYAHAPLADLVFEIFSDLAGLSQSGSVHAKTIYAAINVLRRCPPGPIFALLASDPRYSAAGNCLFRLA